LDKGFHLADLEGFEILGPSAGTNGNAAIQVSQGSTLAQVKNMDIQNFDVGLSANSGIIDNVGTVTIRQFLAGGVLASNNATINIISPITVDGNTSTVIPSFAFYSDFGATLHCESCVGQNCSQNFVAAHGARLIADECVSRTAIPGSLVVGYLAFEKGYISAPNTQVTGCAYGFQVYAGGYIAAGASTSTNAGTYGYVASEGVGTPTYLTGSNDGSYIYGF
jgi:hypothetical protein